jgi:cysteine desulfurase
VIYLDNNSTTPLDERVLVKMLPYLKDRWGNASSRDHAYGWDANDAVEEARSEVAALLNAKRNEVVFTGGATESLALALRGLFPNAVPTSIAPTSDASASSGILTSTVEHEAVLATCAVLRKSGIPVEYLPVDPAGKIDLQGLRTALESSHPKLVCLMAANNETGTLFPIRACAALAHAQGALFLTDAAQALGKIPLDAEADGFDLAAFSAHKINGPKGVGALYIRGGRESVPLEPLMPGGGQEGGLRGGTLNVPAIVGFGEACRLAREGMAEETSRLRKLRDGLEAALCGLFPELRINGDAENRLDNTSSLVFPGTDARFLIRDMHGLAASTRSACSSGSGSASHVLKAMGLSDDDAFASVRFSLGRFTTEKEIERTVEIASASYRKLRADSRPSSSPGPSSTGP